MSQKPTSISLDFLVEVNSRLTIRFYKIRSLLSYKAWELLADYIKANLRGKTRVGFVEVKQMWHSLCLDRNYHDNSSPWMSLKVEWVMRGQAQSMLPILASGILASYPCYLVIWGKKSLWGRHVVSAFPASLLALSLVLSSLFFYCDVNLWCWTIILL